MQSKICGRFVARMTVIVASLLGIGALVFSTFMPAEVALATPPTTEDVERARAEEKYAELTVAQLEVEYVAATSRAQLAQIEASVAAEALNEAQACLEEATAAAQTTAQEALAAKQRYQESLSELAEVSQMAYRSGGGSLNSMAPYLESDGLQNVEKRRNAVSSFSNAADTKMQQVEALRQVADLLNSVAQKAKNQKKEAHAEVLSALEAAEAQAAESQAIATKADKDHKAMLDVLAEKKNTTAQLEAERLAEAKRVREEEERQRAIAAAQEEARRRKPTPSPTPSPTPPAPPSGSVETVMAFARSKIGTAYEWGGTGPRYDCSGIAMMSYRQIGVYLPRTAAQQYNYTGGWKVPYGQAQVGDLVFWSNGSSIYHVALYAGNGTIVEAAGYHAPLREVPIHTWGNVLPYVLRIL